MFCFLCESEFRFGEKVSLLLFCGVDVMLFKEFVF